MRLFGRKKSGVLRGGHSAAEMARRSHESRRRNSEQRKAEWRDREGSECAPARNENGLVRQPVPGPEQPTPSLLQRALGHRRAEPVPVAPKRARPLDLRMRNVVETRELGKRAAPHHGPRTRPVKRTKKWSDRNGRINYDDPNAGSIHDYEF